MSSGRVVRRGRLTEVMGFAASEDALRSTSECISETRERREGAERSLGKREKESNATTKTKICTLPGDAASRADRYGQLISRHLVVSTYSRTHFTLASSPVQPCSPPISTTAYERTSSDDHRKFRSRRSRAHSVTTVALRSRHPRRQGAHPHSPRLGHRPETQGRQRR